MFNSVTLRGIEGKTHRGFLIKAEDSNGNLTGTMIPGDTRNQKVITCGTNVCNNSYFHLLNLSRKRCV